MSSRTALKTIILIGVVLLAAVLFPRSAWAGLPAQTVPTALPPSATPTYTSVPDTATVTNTPPSPPAVQASATPIRPTLPQATLAVTSTVAVQSSVTISNPASTAISTIQAIDQAEITPGPSLAAPTEITAVTNPSPTPVAPPVQNPGSSASSLWMWGGAAVLIFGLVIGIIRRRK